MITDSSTTHPSIASSSGLPRAGVVAAPMREFWARERLFLAVVAGLLIVAGFVFRQPTLAMWFGFAVASYSVVANDSIQTVGTFIASNRERPWWLLWLFIGGIFVCTVGYSWLTHSGDVTFDRLAAKGFAEAPTDFAYLQVAAPIVLLVLTRMKMPVSTTFLLLSCFATSAASVGAIVLKSLTGYAVAFVAAFLVWIAVSRLVDRIAEGKPHRGWYVAQWVTSGTLFGVWVMQDAANIAVYLPRQLTLLELGAFAGAVFLGLGLLFKLGGERVQQVVDEKSKVVDVRAATLIDVVYAAVLYYFKIHSNIPMSTTWVFIGLLGGRELGMALRRSSDLGLKGAAKMMFKDLGLVTTGLAVSMLVALAVNEPFRQAVGELLR